MAMKFNVPDEVLMNPPYKTNEFKEWVSEKLKDEPVVYRAYKLMMQEDLTAEEFYRLLAVCAVEMSKKTRQEYQEHMKYCVRHTFENFGNFWDRGWDGGV